MDEVGEIEREREEWDCISSEKSVKAATQDESSQ